MLSNFRFENFITEYYWADGFTNLDYFFQFDLEHRLSKCATEREFEVNLKLKHAAANECKCVCQRFNLSPKLNSLSLALTAHSTALPAGT